MGAAVACTPAARDVEYSVIPNVTLAIRYQNRQQPSTCQIEGDQAFDQLHMHGKPIVWMEVGLWYERGPVLGQRCLPAKKMAGAGAGVESELPCGRRGV
jgi:hypothetical protein